MRKITMTLAAAIFVVGSMTVANAQTQGASSLNAQAQNATIIHKAAASSFSPCYLRANGFGPEVAGPIANTARQSSPARARQERAECLLQLHHPRRRGS